MSKLNPRAIEILEEQKSILIKKGEDYQNKNSLVTDEDYFRWDVVPGMTMLQTKILRYASVMEKGKDANFESAEDSLRDLINYAARTIAYIEMKNESK